MKEGRLVVVGEFVIVFGIWWQER